MTHATALKLVVFGMLGLPMLRADAFLDVNGVFSTFAVPGAEPGTTVATSINDLGQIAGWFVNSSGATEGFVDTNGVFTTFGPPPLGGNTTSLLVNVTGINDAGQVVGNFFNSQAIPPGPNSFLYVNGVYTFLVNLGAVNGINNSGEVIIYGMGEPLSFSNIYGVNGPVSNVGNGEVIYPGVQVTEALGINNAGEVVGVAILPPEAPFDFLWVNGIFTLINLPGTPSGINDSGQIIGNVGGFGYLDTNGVIQSIDVPGSTGTVALGINDAGAIVGAFTPVPEPASLVLAAAGLTVIALLKRYRAAPRSSKTGEASSGVGS
jgi:hypothetical protein